MPIGWSQVRKGLDPLRFTIRTAPALIAEHDPWADYDDGARALSKAAAALPKL
jgi:bifunctional non-homologous end joining protein LigD